MRKKIRRILTKLRRGYSKAADGGVTKWMLVKAQGSILWGGGKGGVHLGVVWGTDTIHVPSNLWREQQRVRWSHTPMSVTNVQYVFCS